MTPALFVFIPGFFALLMPLFARIRNIEPRFFVALFCLMLALIPLGILSKLQEGELLIQKIELLFLFHFTFAMGFLELLLIMLFSFIALIVAIYSIATHVNKTPKEEVRHSIALLFLLSGSFGMLLSNNIGNLLFFYLYTNFAISLFIQKPLIRAIYFRSISPSAFFLTVGILALYTFLDNGNLCHLAQKPPMPNPTIAFFATIAILLAFCTQIELFPFNKWAMLLSRTNKVHHTALITTIANKSYFIALAQLLGTLFKLYWSFEYVLIVLGSVSMLFANLKALKGESLRKILAYSLMSQIGLIVMTLGFDLHALNEAALFYIINHSLTFTLLYLSIGHLERYHKSTHVNRLRGCAIFTPIGALFFAIGALSLIGFPPSLGFLGKILILKGFASYHFFFPILAIFIASLFEILIYLRIISILYQGKTTLTQSSDMLTFTHIAVILLGILLLAFGFIPSISFLLVGDGACEFMQSKIFPLTEGF